MEIVDLFEPAKQHPSYFSLKPEFRASISPGDVLFFLRKPRYKKEDLDDYLAFLGCYRTNKKQLATKIVDYVDYSFCSSYLLDGAVVEEVLKAVPERDFLEGLRQYTDKLLSQDEFDADQYKQIGQFLKSGQKENMHIALLGIMNLSWKDNDVLLKLLIIRFCIEFYRFRTSDVPGWANFAKIKKLNYRTINYSASGIFTIMSRMTSTQLEIFKTII